MYHPFSVLDTVKTSWYLIKKNFAVLSLYTLAGYFIIALIGILIYYLSGNFATTIGVIILLITVSFVFLGFVKLTFKLIDSEYYDFDFSDIIPKIKMLYSYLLLLIVVSTMSVLLTNGIKELEEGWTQNVLGIIVWAFFQFFFLFYFPICACFIVDDASGPMESVAQSFRLIRGNFIKYFLLFLLIEAMVFIGSVIIIGIFIIIPLINVLLVVTYRKLIYSHQDTDDDLTETH